MFTASQNQNQSIRNAYYINITLWNMRYKGFLNLDTLKNLRSDCWTWVPVNTSEKEDLPLKVFLEGDVKIQLFNENGYWTRELCWHGLTARV